MRRSFIVLLLCIGFAVGAQSLTNTSWYFLKSEIPGTDKKNELIFQQVLLFGDQEVQTYKTGIIITVKKARDTSGNVFMLIVPKPIEREKYNLIGDQLKFNPSGRCFSVLFHDDTLLVLQEMAKLSSGELIGDGVNYYIRDSFYYDYLLENDLLSPEEGSCVEASRLMFPVYSGDYFTDFGKNLGDYMDQDTLSGRLTFNGDARIERISFSGAQIYDESNKVKALRDAFLLTDGKWILPKMKGTCMEVDFSLQKYKWWDSEKNPLILVLKTKVPLGNPFGNNLEPVKDYHEALRFFELGNQLSGREKYEEAVRMFDRSIEMNPNYTDAYFNKAIALFKMGRTEEACVIWKNLALKGDKEAGNLVKQHCGESPVGQDSF
jgi:tetratricopeptide (TPR) repeat protein